MNAFRINQDNAASLYVNDGNLDLLYEVVGFEWVRLYASDNESKNTIDEADSLAFDLVFDAALWEELP